MSDNAKCDRCGGDTGKPCVAGKKSEAHAEIPHEVEVETASGKQKLLWRKHLHLCLACITSLKEWFDAGKPKVG